MDEKPDASLEPTPEQIRYAGFLEKGMYLGLVCLFVTFGVYVFGIMEPCVPHEKLPEYWSESADDYVDRAGFEPAWGWIKMLGYGDFVNFIGIAILAGVTILCYIAIIPLLFRSGDFTYAVLALLEVVVLLVAASGMIAVGH